MAKPHSGRMLSYSAQEVRRYDRDRFVTALFAPAGRREDLFALYAFNLEIAKLRELVKEPALGQIRLQWWRDLIAGLYRGRAESHPLAAPLAAAVDRHQLSRAEFDRLIDGRERDLDDAPPANLAELERYADDTVGSLTALALQILGADGDAERLAGRHVGIAWALTGLLRAVPFHAAAGRLYLPADRLTEAGVAVAALFAGKEEPGLAQVAAAVAGRARHHLAKARGHRGEIGRAATPALLPASQADRYLDALARQGYHLFDTAWSRPRPRPALLSFRAALGRF